METKYVRVPFDIELAKKITSGDILGKVVTRDGKNTRIICFDKKFPDYPIVGLVIRENIEVSASFTSEGIYSKGCAGKNDLMLEIPEYMTFKDGDVYTTLRGCIGIYNSSYKSANGTIPFYVGMRNDGKLIFRPNNDYAGFGSITESMLSTEAEKQKLIEALKASKDPRAKECLKKLGIDAKQEYEFKPFDKVLVRCYNESQWCARFFDRMVKGNYACTDSLRYKQCIPYNEQTAHLLGTNKSE